MHQIQYIMKTIRIPKKARQELKLLSEYGESVDVTLSRLLDGIDKDTCELEGRTNIWITEETYQKILDKKGKSETMVKVVERAIRSHKLKLSEDK